MSTEFLYVVPADPGYVPTVDSRKIALSAFRAMLPQAESVDAVLNDRVRFIDPGMRFETVECHRCGMELDPIWWGDAMTDAEGKGFENLSVRLPCCDASASLNDLRYRMPAGFARFSLEARKPGPGRYLTVDRLQSLEKILGTPLKQIWAEIKARGTEQVRVGRAPVPRAASGRG